EAEDGIRGFHVTGVQTCALPIYDYFKNTSIGRVIVAEKFRDKKLGHELIKTSKRAIEEHFNETIIEISAQEHLKGFYESHGFQSISEVYLEDGIPHIRMLASS